MSDPRVERVRRGLEDYNRGDLEAILPMFAPDVTVFTSPELPNSGTFHGHDGFREWAGAWLEAWETFEVDLVDVTTLGDAIIATLRQVGTGRGSGLQVEMELAYLFRFEGNTAVGLELHPDRETALAAAGG
ncbi:MAG TPA: nuclear transport factor 2 family protein [Thermoleophilaceae bacterium]|nr:nuclear transport factor 2 family protein [Thermoleophilaceae bacterium]